jgi:hypothetical protein
MTLGKLKKIGSLRATALLCCAPQLHHLCAGRQTTNIQCRPCGQEWQPCCANLDALCGQGYICYAEQDRCVVDDYVGLKENYFPSGLLPLLPEHISNK